MKRKIIASVVATTVLAGLTLNTFAAEENTNSNLKNKNEFRKELTAEQKAEFEKIKPILDKKKKGETLTSEEEKTLKAFEEKYPRKHFGKGQKMELTAEQKAEFEKIKPILDKKKKGETLTSEEEKTLKSFEEKYPKLKKFGKKGKMKKFSKENNSQN